MFALILSLAVSSTAVFANASYAVKYSGGSVNSVKAGQDLKLTLDTERVSLLQKKSEPFIIPVHAITEVSYGQEVHRRIGTAAGLAVVSLGVGALVAFSKSKKHYIGLTWDDGGKKGGLVLQADKNEYRGLITALEGITGKKAVSTDPAK
jgi:CxxC motif-containing protein (DUF1111 family)